jgi:hypothetical protein
MPENTTTVWTCSRCGCVEEVEGMGQPKDWCRVGFVYPPRASWADKVQEIGDLCNAPGCGGLIIAFMNGKEDEEAKRQAEVARLLQKVEG